MSTIVSSNEIASGFQNRTKVQYTFVKQNTFTSETKTCNWITHFPRHGIYSQNYNIQLQYSLS